MAAARAEARSKPVVVKANNSLLKSLQKRGPVAIPSGVPKKAKTGACVVAPQFCAVQPAARWACG